MTIQEAIKNFEKNLLKEHRKLEDAVDPLFYKQMWMLVTVFHDLLYHIPIDKQADYEADRQPNLSMFTRVGESDVPR